MPESVSVTPANPITLWLGSGANVTFGNGAFLRLDTWKLEADAYMVFLGSSLQLWADRGNTNGEFILTLALRNAIVELGDVTAGGGGFSGTIRFDSTYVPSLWVPEPPAFPPFDSRFLAPKYHGIAKAEMQYNSFATAAFDVRGDSGLVQLLLSSAASASNPLQRSQFQGTVRVNSLYYAKLVITGQSAMAGFAGTRNVAFPGVNDLPFVMGTGASLDLLYGASVVFGNGTEYRASGLNVTPGLNPAPPLRVEFLTGANITVYGNIPMLAAPPGSAVITDGAVSNGISFLRPRVVTCSTPCLSNGLGSVCTFADPSCTALSCAGVCACAAQSATTYIASYNPATGCNAQSCGPACLGGALCNGTNVCAGGCAATSAAHYSASCQVQDGTCSPPCANGDACQVGGVCPGASSTAGAGATGTAGTAASTASAADSTGAGDGTGNAAAGSAAPHVSAAVIAAVHVLLWLFAAAHPHVIRMV